MASDPFFTDDENTCEDVVFRSRRIVYPLDLASLTPYDAHRDALVAAAAGSTAAAAAADGGDDIDESLVTLRALDVRDHRRLVVEDSLYDKVSDFAPPPVPQKKKVTNSILEAFDPLRVAPAVQPRAKVTTEDLRLILDRFASESDENQIEGIYEEPSSCENSDTPPPPLPPRRPAPPTLPREASLVDADVPPPASLSWSSLSGPSAKLAPTPSKKNNSVKEILSLVSVKEVHRWFKGQAPAMDTPTPPPTPQTPFFAHQPLPFPPTPPTPATPQTPQTPVWPSTPPAGDAEGITGLLHWNVGGKKDSQPLYTELRDGHLTCFSSKGSVSSSKRSALRVVPLTQLASLGAPATSGADGGDWFPFDLVTTSAKTRGSLVAATVAERCHWLRWLLQSSTKAFGVELAQCFVRAGRVYLKAGVTAEWQTAWILVQSDKKLWIHTEGGDGELQCHDLRKVRSASHMRSSVGDVDVDGGCPLALERGAPLVVHCQSQLTFYLQSDISAETERWLQVLRQVALTSGPSLEDQQLTADDVPVLVETCIKFIEAYGMLSEGVYRRSGVQSKVHRLLNALQANAWNVHISKEDYSEHDVTHGLKRFFRTLPEPLLTDELYSQWIAGLALERDQQLELYKRLIGSLPRVNRQCLRKLLAHLHAVQSKCEKNLMSVSNLAALWGPTLMTVESGRPQNSTFSHTNAETDVVLQLIQNYPWLFDVDREQMAVNDAITEIQERLEQGAFGRRNAGDIRTWIHCHRLGHDVAVEVGPRVRVSDVTPQLLAAIESRQPGGCHDDCVLMEVVGQGRLRRPLHRHDLVLPVMLKWSQWSDEDRKDNQLVFGPHPFVGRLQHFMTLERPRTISEVFYAGPKSKSFRLCPFEFCQARFTLLKDTKNHSILGRWDVEKIFWYLGCDSKRTPPTEWCLTFIECDAPLKKNRVGFGHCVSFGSEADFWLLMTSLVLTQYEGGPLGFAP